MSESDYPLSAKELWGMEYTRCGIPSSSRTSPSGAVVWAYEELKRRGYPLRTALDVGCGKGRNSLYLAQQGMSVTAIDFTPDAVSALIQAGQLAGVSSSIRPLVYDATEPWPVPDNSMDLVVDAFCFKHIVGHDARTAYRQSLLRTLSARGHYLVSFASIGDGYYGQYVADPRGDGAAEEAVVVDPVNGIESVLYSKKRLVQYLYPELDVVAEHHNAKPSAMHGREYPRSTYALIFGRSMRVL